MDTDLFWIGLLLLTGFLLFAGGVMLPERGGIGRRVWSVPHEEVGKNPRIWKNANLLFIASGVGSTVAVVSLAVFLASSGSRLFAPAAATLFLLANGLWIVFSAYRGAVIPWASEKWAEDGVTPSVYKPLSDLADALGTVYMLLGYLATAALGAALLEVGLLPAWIGWLGVVSGLALGLVMTTGWPRVAGQEGTIAHIPAWTQIVPTVVGVALIVEAV